ncbi:MAG: hypothetical protein AAFQ14_18685 [Cyanobacteria bacterium J06621_12]
MSIPLELPVEQIKVIEANGAKIAGVARDGYRIFDEKGTIVLLRQFENENLELADWQIKYKPISMLAETISDWKESGLQDLIIKYNPETSVICTFLYPDGTHTSYHFSLE